MDGVDNPPTVLHPVTKRSSINEKVTLFRSYFRGRDDVYAVRGVNRTGKAPYYPKRQYSKENGEVIWGDNLPLTNDVIRAHLQDEQHPVTVGLYPLLLDETCWFLAIDFDKDSWKNDVTAFLGICYEFNVPAALERSRSGNGGHVWIFFREPIAARMARALGETLLTRTLENRHQIGLDSYDRMFPNQDTLPNDKKLGNLIALPLQRLPGKEGNSLFIDVNDNPYPDQWVYLSSLRKMKFSEVEAIVQEAVQRGDTICVAKVSTKDDEGAEPWNLSPQQSASSFPGTLPKNMKIILANMLYVEKKGLNSSQISYFTRLAAFQNPEFYRAQAMRLSTYGKPRVIDCSQESPQYIALPRGCQEEVVELLHNHGTAIAIEDKRTHESHIDVNFHGQLRDEQERAVMELSKHDIGTLSATTAFGKTVIGAWMIAARGTNTLILVHRTQLMEQWRERLSVFLNISTKEIGTIGGGKHNRTGRIDVALIQSLYANREVKDFVADYGHIVVDECHHISAVRFEQVLKHARAKYILGLTATLTRKDGKHPIVLMQCGPIRYKVDARAQAMRRPFDHVVVPRYTNFRLSDTESEMPIQQVYERLLSDELRNDMIFDDLLKSLDQGRSPILLTDRTSHLEYFEERLKGFAKNVIVLRGGMGKKQWKATQEHMRSIPMNTERVILATGRFVGEGFDDERLDTLFLVMPISWKGTLQQYAGRLHRLYDTKHEVQIYDYVDDQVPMLSRMYKKRLKGYQAMGYTERNTH
jgi:superfamily II DNA or RNA helicase